MRTKYSAEQDGPSSRVLECDSRSITGAGMGVGLWVIGTGKGEGGLLWDKASAKLFAVPGKCTADRSRLNRAGIKCRRRFRRMNAGSLPVPVLRVCVCQAVGCAWQQHSK